MLESSKVRSAIGTFIFLCAGALFCYQIYPALHLTYLAYFDHSKNYDVVTPSPLEWVYCALVATAILIALVRKWRWSTVPLWLLTLVLSAVGIVNLRNPDVTLDRAGFAVFLAIPVAIQIAVLLRRDYKKSPTPL